MGSLFPPLQITLISKTCVAKLFLCVMPSKVLAVCVKISVKFYLNISDLLQSKNLVYKQGIYYLL